MPQVRYITSESQLGAPGVYVEELAPASEVRGELRRIVGIVGQCVRGPVGKVVECRTYGRFLEVFGGRDKNTNGGTILGHVWKSLQGFKWGKFYVCRAAAAAAVTASFTLETAAGGGGTQVVRIDAANPGTWGNDVYWKVAAATDADATHWNLYIRLYGKVYTFENLSTSAGADNTNIVIGNDDGTLVRLTKLADGRPVNSAAGVDGADTTSYTKLGQTVASFVSVAGTDGAIADADYTTAGGPIEKINNTRGVHVAFVAGRSNTAVKTKISTVAAGQAEKVWLVCPDSESTAQSTAITERATFSTDKMSYLFNHPYINDPITDEEIVTEPMSPVASIITQTNPNIHIADIDNAVLTKSIRRFYNDLGDADRDSLDSGGVTFLHRDLDQNGNVVMVPGNGLTCDFAINNRDLDGRYMKNFVIFALANSMRGDQFKGNTKAARAARKGRADGFLNQLARDESYIAKDEDTEEPQFSYTNGATVNNKADQRTGLQKDLLRAQLVAKNRIILLLAEVGPDVTITERQ